MDNLLVSGIMVMYKNIIFDCFGTLIDTGSGSVEAVKKILDSVGCDADSDIKPDYIISTLKELIQIIER